MTQDIVVKQQKDDFTWCEKPIRVGIHDFILFNNRLFVELQIDTGRPNIEYRWIDVLSTTNYEKKINDFLKPTEGKPYTLETKHEMNEIHKNIKTKNTNHKRQIPNEVKQE